MACEPHRGALTAASRPSQGMQSVALALFLALTLGAPVVEARTADQCVTDIKALLAMEPKAFQASGWRVLGEREGCEIPAADLMRRFRSEQEGRLDQNQRLRLIWHEAQLRAAAGQTPVAIALFSASRQAGNTERNLYADATVAFLRKDRPELERLRAIYADMPPPAGFAESATRFEAANGRKLIWPPNLAVIDGFLACFDKPYGVAYAQECRPEVLTSVRMSG